MNNGYAVNKSFKTGKRCFDFIFLPWDFSFQNRPVAIHHFLIIKHNINSIINDLKRLIYIIHK